MTDLHFIYFCYFIIYNYNFFRNEVKSRILDIRTAQTTYSYPYHGIGNSRYYELPLINCFMLRDRESHNMSNIYILIFVNNLVFIHYNNVLFIL